VLQQTRRSAPYEFKKKMKTVEHLQLTVEYLAPVVCVAVAPPATFEFYTALMLTITFFWVVMLNAGPTAPDVSREPTAFICEVLGAFLSQSNTPEPHSPSLPGCPVTWCHSKTSALIHTA